MRNGTFQMSILRYLITTVIPNDKKVMGAFFSPNVDFFKHTATMSEAIKNKLRQPKGCKCQKGWNYF